MLTKLQFIEAARGLALPSVKATFPLTALCVVVLVVVVVVTGVVVAGHTRQQVKLNNALLFTPGMLTRPTWHEAKAEARERVRLRPRPKKFLEAEAEAKMYEAEARYSRSINHYIRTNCHKRSIISANVLTK